MLNFRRCPWFLASTFVLVTLGSSCSKTDESVPEAEPVVIPAAADEALAGHEFLRLTEARSGAVEELYVDRRIEIAVDDYDNYYLGVGSRVLVVERGPGTTHVMRVIELSTPLELLGIRGEDLILFGKDPSRCTNDKGGKLYPMPGQSCASVFAMPLDGEGPLRVVAAFDGAFQPVLVSDHVASLVDEHVLMHVALDEGEVRRTTFEASTGPGELAVNGDRLVWTATASKGSEEHSAVFQSRAPFDAVEQVFQLDAPRDTGMIIEVVWIGESLAYLVANMVSDSEKAIKLYRRTGDQTDLLLTGLSAATWLVNDGSSAWLLDFSPDESRLWRIGLKEHRRVTNTTSPKLVTGTRSGLAWVEEHEGTVGFHLTSMGPPGLVAPEARAAIVDAPARKAATLPVDADADAVTELGPTVDGDIPADIVKRIVRAHRKETEACYATALKKNPELGGTLTVAFVIAKTGKVGKTEIVGEFPDPALGKCVTKALAKWTFPKPGDGEPVDVSFPFAFSPTGD